MEYIVYRRFKAEGIDGAFNLRYGTTVTERGGFLFAADGRKICAATSENGWERRNGRGRKICTGKTSSAR